MNIKFATFSKRENSTATFAGTWTDKTCYLKESCSIISPVIELAKDSSILAFNYAYIADFGRYYFVSDIVCDGEAMNVYLRCDVLASYKSEIGNSSEYILRSASDYDGDVIDTLYPTKTDVVFDIGSSSGAFDEKNITYVIGVLNNTDTHKFGATKYYAIDSGNLGNLMKFLFGTNIVTDMETFVSGFSVELQNAIIRSLSNPAQFIVESYALPYIPPQVSSLETMTIGYLPTTISGYPLDETTSQKTVVSTIYLDLPSHPLSATRGHYLSSAPYTRYILDLGVFGIYPLDASLCINYSQVGVTVTGDQFGNVRCIISLGAHIIDVLSANVKCNFPVGQVSYDVLGATRSIADTMISGVGISGDNDSITRGVENVASGILSSVNSLLPQCHRIGNQGTFINAFTNFTSRAQFLMPVDEDNTHRGRPLCEVRTINTLSGYVLVSDADISISGTKEENEQIKRYMNTGFYYE